MDLPTLLDQAAEVFGIEPEYWDISGRHHVTSAELKRAILTSLRVPCDSPESLERALSTRALKQWSAVGPAVHVLTQGEPLSIPVNLPATESLLRLAAVIAQEDGAQTRLDLDLSAAAATGRTSIEGRNFERRTITLPLALEPGYHDVHWELNGAVDGHTRLIVCPPRAWVPDSLAKGEKRAGLAVSLYGIHSQHTWAAATSPPSRH